MSQQPETPANPVRLADATVDQLAEAVAAGVHVGLRRLFADPQAFRDLDLQIEAAERRDAGG